MTHRSVSDALAVATASMVRGQSATGPLARLVADVVDVLGAAAAAIIVQTRAHGLEVLTASSHRVEDIEAYQVLSNGGPCIDCIEHGAAVAARGRSEIVDRWPDTGAAIVSAGYSGVRASPLRWRGRTFGGLNVFFTDGDVDPLEDEAAQAFADAATMLILSSATLDENLLDRTLLAALEGRAVVEQAKGALAQLRSLDMDRAYHALLELAAGGEVDLADAARSVLQRASEGTLG